MRSGGSILLKLLVFLTVVFAAGALAWMLFLPAVLTSQIQARTGFPATVERLMINPFTGRIEVRGLVIGNASSFGAPEFVALRSFTADANPSSLFSDAPVFNDVIVDLARVTVVTRVDGSTNADAFFRSLGSKSTAQATGTKGAAETASTSEKTSRRFLIRRLTVRFDTLVTVELTETGAVSKTRESAIGLRRTYTDVSEETRLVPSSAVGNIGPVDAIVIGLVPEILRKTLGDTAKSGEGFLKETGRKTEQKVRGFLDALEESKKP
jgi:hypothetical protein